ncbi:Reverse transcriptase RNA-dependent DNA polymerase [Trinorchestia longiramus]|nr:Reverse transcriptase RNA-dependent DNA polymerase [Trinorchestia longiramus]
MERGLTGLTGYGPSNLTFDGNDERVNSIPKSYSEAISSPDSVEWQKIMSDEMAALVDNETFELVTKPKERSVIGGRWVYSVKSGPNDQEIFKARYVAKGYSQVADVDFTETFSPTARLTSVRMLMDIAVQKSYIVHQMDVCTAYLHAKIDCNVFVVQPEGFIELDKMERMVKEKIQRKATKMIPELRNLSYERRLQRLELISLEQRRLRGQLIQTFKYLNGLNNVTLEGLFERDGNVRTRNNGQKLLLRNFKTSQAMNFSPVKIAATWNQLPENIVSAGTVNTFKNRLDIFWITNPPSTTSY